MPRTLQFKRFANTVVANTTGANGEFIIDSTNHTITIHDGVTRGGHAMASKYYVDHVGIQGNQGATGAQGASGVTGGQGATGISGATGSAGTNGATGIQGASGVNGATGISGATGSAGTNGATGVDGATGVGTQGATGVSGATGPQGTIGAGNLLLLDSFTGSYTVALGEFNLNSYGNGFTVRKDGSVVDAYINEIIGLGNTNWTFVPVGDPANTVTKLMNTPQSNVSLGDDPGHPTWVINTNDAIVLPVYATNGTQYAIYVTDLSPFGTNGTNGASGVSGASGVTGATGSAGINGATGTGINGATGSAGTNGATGVSGATGPSGTNGATGVQGASGANLTSGSWTITAGTNTYEFTVPANAAYQLWVRGNIPDGIITYIATVSVTNTNVPVLGNQYAWNYTGGGSPIAITSIPDQIVGTVGAISTATVSGTTNNVFRFGISNSTGSSQTVYWGYVKLS